MISNKKKTARILFSAGALALSFFALAAMLGQLDIILAGWYADPKGTWELPLPFIFNARISSLLGWEIIYAFIVLSFFVAYLSGFVLGRESK